MNVIALRNRGKLSTEQLQVALVDGLSDEQIAMRHSCSLRVVRWKRCALGVNRPRGRKPGTPNGDGGAGTRHDPRPLVGKTAKMPAFDNEAIVNGRTIYPASVVGAKVANSILVSGVNHWKIGARVTKGRWKGFPIYALTLEERATCPTSCRHWRSCFGNQMNWARRIRHGADLQERLTRDLAALQESHPNGFGVRLHVLGDFYSVEYVKAWALYLRMFPALHVFGFTARWQREDPIAVELVKLTIAKWRRFAIRFSNAPIDECATVSIEHPGQNPPDAIICPAQIGKTANCGTCGLCWATRRRIAFVQH